MEKENLKEQAQVSPAESDKAESASYGKFKTGEELLNAYNALEAEFTRRSQRFKELEGALNAKAESDKWADKVKALGEKYPVARNLGKELTNYLERNEGLIAEDDCLEKALLHILAERWDAGANGTSPAGSAERGSGEATSAEAAKESEKEAESVVAKRKTPVIPVSGGEIPIVPPYRVSSVGEAGKMAMEIFNKTKGE